MANFQLKIKINYFGLIILSIILHHSSIFVSAGITNVTPSSVIHFCQLNVVNGCNQTNSNSAHAQLSNRFNKDVFQDEKISHSLKSAEFNSHLPIIHITRGFFGNSITIAQVRGNNPNGIPAHVVLSEWSRRIGPKNSPVISSCALNYTLFKQAGCPMKECPWFVRGKYNNGIDGLTEEIEDFFTYARPTREALNARLEVFERVRKFVKGIWPNSRVELFGSIRTGLFLPTSDLDVIILGDWETMPYKFLADAAIENNLTDPSKVLIRYRARVPIVRITDKISGMGVDFVFNEYKAPVGVQLIKIFSERYPELPKMLFILKKLLVKLDLNSASLEGGISSFYLIQMIVTILQIQPPLHGGRPPQLGHLLLQFCDFFSHEYNYVKSMYRVVDCGIYVPTPEDYRNGFASLLARIDGGLRPVNAIGSGVARGSWITSAITLTFQALQRGLDANAGEYGDSILANIFRITRDELNSDTNRPECHRRRRTTG